MQTLSDFRVPEQPVATHRDVPGEPIQEQTKATIAVWFSVFFALAGGRRHQPSALRVRSDRLLLSNCVRLASVLTGRSKRRNHCKMAIIPDSLAGNVRAHNTGVILQSERIAPWPSRSALG